MNTFLTSLLDGHGPEAVLILMAIAFAETGLLAGFFLPGDSLLFAAGVLIAAGTLHVPLLVAVLAVGAAAAIGDQVGYAIGRRVGPLVFQKPGARFLAPEQIERARAFFERHGRKTVVLARFVPVVRTITPTMAGVGRMERGVFTLYNVAGGLAWATTMLLAGYLFGGIAFVSKHIDLITVGVVALSLVPAGAGLLRRHRPVASHPSTQNVDEGKHRSRAAVVAPASSPTKGHER